MSVNDSKIKSYCLFPQSFSSTKIQIVLLFSFRFSHFLNLRVCKNDHFLFIMGTSSLEARNIRFVNSNLSRVQESKIIPQVDHKMLFVGKFGVELHQFHGFQIFYIDC